MMKRLAPRVAGWVERMTAATGPKAPADDFLAHDEVPESLMPILGRMAAEHVPVIADTIARTAAWIDENPDRELPRAIGSHTFQIGAVTAERLVFPYLQWMAQRPIDHYQNAPAEEKQALDRCLSRFGGEALVKLALAHRVARRNNKLYRA